VLAAQEGSAEVVAVMAETAHVGGAGLQFLAVAAPVLAGVRAGVERPVAASPAHEVAIALDMVDREHFEVGGLTGAYVPAVEAGAAAAMAERAEDRLLIVLPPASVERPLAARRARDFAVGGWLPADPARPRPARIMLPARLPAASAQAIEAFRGTGPRTADPASAAEGAGLKEREPALLGPRSHAAGRAV
jgi:hypothetical protein